MWGTTFPGVWIFWCHGLPPCWSCASVRVDSSIVANWVLATSMDFWGKQTPKNHVRLWEIFIFFHFFGNESPKSLLLSNNMSDLIYLHHIWVKKPPVQSTLTRLIKCSQTNISGDTEHLSKWQPPPHIQQWFDMVHKHCMSQSPQFNQAWID